MSGCVAPPNKRGEPLNDVSFSGKDENLTAYRHHNDADINQQPRGIYAAIAHLELSVRRW